MHERNLQRLGIYILFLIFLPVQMQGQNLDELRKKVPIASGSVSIKSYKVTTLNNIKLVECEYVINKEPYSISRDCLEWIKKAQLNLSKRERVTEGESVHIYMGKGLKIIVDMQKINPKESDVSILRMEGKNLDAFSFNLSSTKDAEGFDLVNVPRYYNTVRIYSMKMAMQEKTMYNVTYQTPTAPWIVVQEMFDKMKAMGWETDLDKPMNKEKVWGFFMNDSKNKSKVTIWAVRDNELKCTLVSALCDQRNK